jgi:transcription elongation factor GreB
MPKLITKVGYDKIMAEIDRLWTQERPEVVEEVYQAALLGDRSENAAYIYGKQRLRRIDSRLQFLRGKVKEVKVVNTDFLPQIEQIQFGALVTMEDENGEEHIIRLVDQNESEPKQGRISVQSPIGKSLLGLKTGEIAEVRLPKGNVEYEVINVHYGQDPRKS